MFIRTLLKVNIGNRICSIAVIVLFRKCDKCTGARSYGHTSKIKNETPMAPAAIQGRP